MSSLRLEIKRIAETDRLEIIWLDSNLAVRSVISRTQTSISTSQLSNLRERMGRELQKAKTALGSNLAPSWAEINSCAKILWDMGIMLLGQLFQNNSRNVIDCWQKTLNPMLPVGGYGPPVITLVDGANMESGESSFMLPFEFLPLFLSIKRSPQLAKIDSCEALNGFLANFVAGRCIVARALSGEHIPTSDNAVLTPHKNKSKSHLSAKMFVCQSLEGVRDELSRLRGNYDNELKFDVWPRQGCAGNPEKLVKYLWRTTHCSRGLKRCCPDQIHHFAIHFTKRYHPDDHFLTLAGTPSTLSNFDVALRELEVEFRKLQISPKGKVPERNKRPIVFMNACGSSSLDPVGISSLPDFFLRMLGNRGFIGTEATMSDSFAPEFAMEFYRRLFDGATVGRALYDARRSLVARFNNPLGLFYTCYVHPTLRIASN